MRHVAPVLLMVLASCGRLGFDRLGDAASDGLVGDADTLPAVGPTILVPANATGTASIAWDGDGYGVAWQQTGAPYPEIYFMRLDRDGAPVTTPLRVWDGVTADVLPEVFAAAGRYGVAWRFGGTLAFQLIAAQGTAIGNVYSSSGGGINQPTPVEIGSNGAEFTVVWGTTAFNMQNVLFSTFDGAGTATVESQVLVSGAGLSMVTSRPWWSGTAWVVAGVTAGDVWSRQFATQPVGSSVRLDATPDTSLGPQLIQTPTGLAAVWIDSLSSQSHLLEHRALDRDGVPVADPVSVTPVSAGTAIRVFKPTATGSELLLYDQTAYTRLALDGAGALVGSPTVVDGIAQTAGLGKAGPGLAMVWVDANTGELWFQRLE